MGPNLSDLVLVQFCNEDGEVEPTGICSLLTLAVFFDKGSMFRNLGKEPIKELEPGSGTH